MDDLKNILSSRLMCLDVYRGLMVAGMIVVDNPGSDEHAYWPIMHTKWNGWTPADFIFPSFLFLVGISMVYSYSARRERGDTKREIFAHAIKRSLILIAIGLVWRVCLYASRSPSPRLPNVCT